MNVKAINCTSCAAPVKINGGGHRIRSLNCNYCGAVMDVKQEYRLLGQFLNQSKPSSPLQIGMEGKIKDIDFMIIGMVGYRSNYGDTWVDLFLFSATHGYAHLTYSMGHFVFTRRVRYLPDKHMRQLSPHETFHVDQKQYTFFEVYQSEVTYVAGELTWIAKQGDTCMVRDAIAPPFMFTQEIRDDEQEYYLSEYLEPKEVQQHFKSTYETKRSKRFKHPAQPFAAPIRQALSKASRVAMLIAIIMMIFISLFGSGHSVYSNTLEANEIKQGTLTKDFSITNAKHMIELTYQANLNNAWTNYDITLFKDDFEVFSFRKQLAYYTGRDAEGSWSEGSQTGTARFKVKETGNYSLRVHAIQGGTGNNGKSMQHNNLTIDIKEGVMGLRYMVILFIIGLISYLWFYGARYMFEKARWEGNSDD